MIKFILKEFMSHKICSWLGFCFRLFKIKMNFLWNEIFKNGRMDMDSKYFSTLVDRWKFFYIKNLSKCPSNPSFFSKIKGIWKNWAEKRRWKWRYPTKSFSEKIDLHSSPISISSTFASFRSVPLRNLLDKIVIYRIRSRLKKIPY